MMILQQSAFRQFAAKYYHLFLWKLVSVDICCSREVSFWDLTTAAKLSTFKCKIKFLTTSKLFIVIVENR